MEKRSSLFARDSGGKPSQDDYTTNENAPAVSNSPACAALTLAQSLSTAGMAASNSSMRFYASAATSMVRGAASLPMSAPDAFTTSGLRMAFVRRTFSPYASTPTTEMDR